VSVTRSDHPRAAVNADYPAVSRCDTHLLLINHSAACAAGILVVWWRCFLELYINWIMAFLTGRSQVCKTSGGRFSDPQPITSSIVQGSGIGPNLWLIVESDLHQLSDANVIFKYADDTNLLVTENTDYILADEFSHIKNGQILMVLLLILVKLKNWFYIAHTLLGITSRSLLQVLSRSLL